jgi:hypothetical protein
MKLRTIINIPISAGMSSLKIDAMLASEVLADRSTRIKP